jgi:cation:H+ antiporter
VVAAARGQRDIAVGHVIGSNLFNLLGVLGAAALVAGDGLPVAAEALRTDVPLSLVATLVVLPVLVTGMVIERWEGFLLVAAYGGYVAVALLTGTGHPAAGTSTRGLFAGLAVVAVVVTTVGWRRRQRGRSSP